MSKDQPAIAWEMIISKDTLDSVRLPNLGQAGSGGWQRPTAGRRADRSGCPQTACFVKGSAQGPQKKSKSIRKPVFSRRNLDFQLRKATQTHQNPVENPTPPWDAPRRAPDPPRVLPGHPRTSRSAKKIREPAGNQFFGARIEFSGSETLQNPPGTTRKPSPTVGRAGEGPGTAPGASLTPPDV